MAFDVGAFNFASYGSGGSNHHGFGRKDLRAAQDQGASRYQLEQLREHARRVGAPEGKFLAGDFAALGPAPKSPWDYGGHGYWGFGLADVNAMGGDLDRIKGARDWARQNRLNIGPGVAGAIQGLENDRRFEEQQAFNAQLLQQQQQQAEEAIRIQEEMAARAARVKGNSPTGVGGNAAFRGSRLSITEAGGRGGTRRFSRPGTQFMDTLNSGNTAGTTTKSTLNI